MVVVKLFSSLCRKNLRGRMSDHFRLDQFYNKDELFTSFSLTIISGHAVSWLAVWPTKRDPLKTGRSPSRSDVCSAALKMSGVTITTFS